MTQRDREGERDMKGSLITCLFHHICPPAHTGPQEEAAASLFILCITYPASCFLPACLTTGPASSVVFFVTDLFCLLSLSWPPAQRQSLIGRE